jgi:hypothetical protein
MNMLCLPPRIRPIVGAGPRPRDSAATDRRARVVHQRVPPGQVSEVIMCCRSIGVSIGLAFMLCTTARVDAQLEGMVLIDQAAATAGAVTPGDGPDFPVTLSQPGSYRLSGNLVVVGPNTTAIEIASDNVTLDLNGFTISGPAGMCRQTLRPTWCTQTTQGVGVRGRKVGTSTLHSNIAVFGGTVRDMGSHGLLLGSSARVERVSAVDNRGYGVFATFGALIANNTTRENSEAGIYCFSGLVFGNSVIGVSGIQGYNVIYGNNLAFGPEDTGFRIEVAGGGVNAGGNLCLPGPCPP